MRTVPSTSTNHLRHSQSQHVTVARHPIAPESIQPDKSSPSDRFINSRLTFSGNDKKRKVLDPAPEASLNDLPLEVLSRVAYLGAAQIEQSNNDKFALFHFLSALKRTSKSTQGAILNNPILENSYANLQAHLPSFNLLFEAMPKTLAQLPLLTLQLNLVPPSARQRVVNIALDPTLSDMRKVESLRQLSQGIRWLSHQQHNNLIQTVLGFQEKSTKSLGIQALATELRWFSEAQRDSLLKEALELEKDFLKLEAFSVFAKQAQWLSHDQKDKLIQGVLQLQNPISKARVLNECDETIKFFSKQQRDTLIQALLQVKQKTIRNKVITSLLNGVQYLDNSQKGQLLDAVLASEDDNSKMLALAQFSENLRHLTPEQRKRLIEGILSSDDGTSYSIRGVGKNFQLLEEQEKSALLEKLAKLMMQARSCSDISHQQNLSITLAGLGQGLQHLEPFQRQKFVEYTDTITDEPLKKMVLVELISDNRLTFFSRFQQACLIQQALNFQDPALKNEFLFHILGSLQLLDPTLRPSIVRAALSQPNSLQVFNKALEAVAKLPAGDRGQLMLDRNRR